MSNLDKLIQYFEQFPGIGARQARRFAFHILTLPKADIDELASLIANLQGSVVECESCHRFFSKNGGSATQCSICSDQNRERDKLMVVERDSDIVAIERSGTYNGMYFVLGGTIPLLNAKNPPKLRSGALKSITEHRAKNDSLSEIILGFAVNPDGENTGRYVESLLKDVIAEHNIKVTELGRGLSTGSELEYADPETLKNALQNRH
jgi:recombination protein RecR